MKNKETMPFIEQLLNGENVEWKKLGEVCSLIRGKRLTKRDLDINDIYPVYHGGIEPIGYYNQSNRKANSTMIINVGASAGTVGYSANDFWSSDGCFCFSHNEQLNQRYLYYSLQNIETFIKSKVRKAGIPTLDNKVLENIKIPLPPLSVQHRIVEILDKFTELEANLEAELDCHKRQYEYYRNQLLSFDMLNRGGQKLNDVKIMTLGEIAKYSSTRIKSSCLCETSFVGVDNLLQYRKGKTISTHVPTEGTFAEYQVGDILIGNIRPYLKKIWYADNSGGASGDVLVIHLTNEQIMSRYLYQVLADDKFFSYNMQHAKGAKMPRGNKQKIMEYKIPLPPLSVQREIVEILDKFDTLCNSISEGLPKEIELRRKQYEYYRNQLLTFAQ